MLLFSDLLIWLNLYDDQIACQCWCRQSANTQHTKLKSGASNLHGAGASNLQDNNMDAIFAIMTEEKGNQKETLKIITSKLKKYFPKNTTPKQMEDTIIKLLERELQRKRGRESR